MSNRVRVFINTCARKFLGMVRCNTCGKFMTIDEYILNAGEHSRCLQRRVDRLRKHPHH